MRQVTLYANLKKMKGFPISILCYSLRFVSLGGLLASCLNAQEEERHIQFMWGFI